MASVERRMLDQRDGSGRVRRGVRYKLRYRDPDDRVHSETFARRDDARRRTEIEASLVSATPAISYYDLGVVEETIRGKPVTEEQIQVWADEAEKGFPVEQLRKRGRRSVGDGPGEIIAVRMDESLLAQRSARAERDRISRSEAIRAALKAWIDAA